MFFDFKACYENISLSTTQQQKFSLNCSDKSESYEMKADKS